MVLESQLPHTIVHLSFRLVKVSNKLTILWGGSEEGSQTVRLKAPKADLGECRKFSDDFFETEF